MKFSCTICNSFSSSTLKKVLRHIGSVHSFEPNFQITCGVDGCARTYTNFKSFQKHLSRRHETVFENNVDVSTPDLLQSASQVEIQESANTSGNLSLEEMPNHTHSIEANKKGLKRSSALFLLRTKEINRVTQVALNEIIEGVTELFQTYASPDACICSSATPFAGLETQYLQQKYYQEEFNLVVSYN